MTSSGHINATLGLANILKDRGHRVIFATEKSWQGKFLRFGYEEVIYTEKDPNVEELSPNAFWVDVIKKLSPAFKLDPIDSMIKMDEQIYGPFVDTVKYSDSEIQRILEEIKPDLIIQDNYLTHPSIVTSGIPWIFLMTANPLMLPGGEGRCPPATSGYKTTDKSKWNTFLQV